MQSDPIQAPKERRFTVQVERVRGERPFYSLLEWNKHTDQWDSVRPASDDDYDGSYDRRKVERWARKFGVLVEDES